MSLRVTSFFRKPQEEICQAEFAIDVFVVGSFCIDCRIGLYVNHSAPQLRQAFTKSTPPMRKMVYYAECDAFSENFDSSSLKVGREMIGIVQVPWACDVSIFHILVLKCVLLVRKSISV